MASPTIVHLSPVKNRRKLRPSLSPQKSNTLEQHLKRPATVPPPSSPPAFELPVNDLQTAAVVWPFSAWDEHKKELGRLTEGEYEIVENYLSRNYSVLDIMQTSSMLVLRCAKIPPVGSRPFLVAGLVAVWLGIDSPMPSDLQIGDLGNGKSYKINADLAADLRPFRIPRVETLDKVGATLFPDAEHIMFLTDSLIIELPENDAKDHFARISKFPPFFDNSDLSIRYLNGPMIPAPHSRLKTPKPQLYDAEFDDTDYLKKLGAFCPGAMLRSKERNMISAGVAVSNGPDVRLTVAFHTWEAENAQDPQSLGAQEGSFEVFQADTPAANVVSRVGSSDIGLAKFKKGIKFHNTFLDINTTAKSLLPQQAIKFNDFFQIDSFVTGVQPLTCLGIRRRTSTGRKAKDLQPFLEFGVPYLAVDQGIYATNAPEIYGKPQIRDGVCGSPLVRVRTSGENKDLTLSKGQIGAFMHWPNVRDPYSSGPRLLCFCDSVQPLIDRQWEIAGSDFLPKESETTPPVLPTC